MPYFNRQKIRYYVEFFLHNILIKFHDIFRLISDSFQLLLQIKIIICKNLIVKVKKKKLLLMQYAVSTEKATSLYLVLNDLTLSKNPMNLAVLISLTFVTRYNHN